MKNKIKRFDENSKIDTNIRKDLSDIRDYLLGNNDNGSIHYQQTLTKLNRVEQYIIDNLSLSN
jgi:hypothetical protein